MNNDVQDVILSTIEASLEAQLRAVRKLRKSSKTGSENKKTGRSQMSVVYDVLKKSKQPIHISEIIHQADTLFHVQLDRESIVSALSKKVVRHEIFKRTSKNTFALIEDEP